LWIFYILVTGRKFETLFNFLKLDFTVSLILSAYLIGHLVQAISNIFESWEKKKKEEKKENFNFVMQKARKLFDLPNDLSEKIVWQYCYLFALSNDFSGHIELFNSMHSLFRGFWIGSYIGFIGSLFVLITEVVAFFVSKYTKIPDWRLLLFALITLGLSVLFNRRKKRFFEYMGEKVLITFDILSRDVLNKK
jgi:membrane protein implicated in regulation of membrane protease activity